MNMALHRSLAIQASSITLQYLATKPRKRHSRFKDSLVSKRAEIIKKKRDDLAEESDPVKTF